jgi:hypothetical protein
MTGADRVRGRRHLAAALLLAALVVGVRSTLVAAAHSECFDARYHVDRGLAFLTGSLAERGLILNDPPLGEGLVALPLAVLNVVSGRPADAPWDTFYYVSPPGPEASSVAVALWKTVLFLPMIAVVFAWCRDLYGLPSAWLAVSVLLVEPTIAAHVPVMALDVLGLEGIVVATYALWLFALRPTARRGALAGLATGIALSLKHTALVLPLVGLALMVAYRWRARHRGGEDAAAASLPRGGMILVAAALVAIWAGTLFDLHTPPLFDAKRRGPAAVAAPPAPEEAHPRLAGLEPAERVHLKETLRLRASWPAGVYVHALIQGVGHGATGHPAYLLGETSTRGWWYYQAVAATYKVPLGIVAIFCLGLLSLRWRAPRFDECSLLLPALAYAAFVAVSRVSIGFRHALPGYVFAVLLASRVLAGAPAMARTVVWASLAAAAAHAASFHPDYIAYFNFPRDRPYLAISDSNVDWGQSLRQVRDWLDARPDAAPPVTLAYFGQSADHAMLRYYLGDRVRIHRAGEALPESGTLVVSPVLVAGVYGGGDGVFAPLRSLRPDAVIGHAMLVYDLVPSPDRPGSPPSGGHGTP